MARPYLADSGEVGIKAMSGDDEIILKSPNALMSGEAIKQVLLNCVDGLKSPESLLINDVDILLAKIRSISYGEGNNDLNTKCPKCEEENTFSVDLEALIDKSSKLEGEYSVTLSNGLQVFVTPFTYKDKIATLKVAFQQEKIKKSMVMSSEEEQLATLTSSIKMMTDLNYNLLTNVYSDCMMRVTA